MATTVTGKIGLTLQATQNIVNGIVNAPAQAQILIDMQLPNGTSNGQIDRCYFATATGIAASTTTAYDLAGSLTDYAGTTITFAEVCLIAVRNLSTTAVNRIQCGPGDDFGVEGSNVGFWSANTWRATVNADYSTGNPNSGSWLVMYSHGGVPVTAGTADDFSVFTQSGSSSNTWDILIMGRSA